MPYRMANTVQPYAWGSRTALREVYAMSGGGPMAELWMGAHPKAPSMIETATGTVSLEDHIARDPAAALGNSCADRFGTLPFLFKILCADRPLSLQVHPTLEAARAGFAAEQARGLAPDDPLRNYRDGNHKPELICAITPFWGLRGFRPAQDIRAELTTVELRKADSGLAPPSTDADLAGLFRGLLLLADEARRELIAAAVSLSRDRWRSRDISSPPEPGDPLARYYWVLRVADEYPGDVGILSPLFLNVFSLKPGQAIYQGAGVLHAYLCGTGAELMANSDNVLRGGMTEKHIDVAELMRVGTFWSEVPVILDGETPAADDPCARRVYAAPFEEFEFAVLAPGTGCVLAGGVPRVLFCHRGRTTVSAGGIRVTLVPGQSAFVDASEGPVAVDGGEVFEATVPQ